MSLKKTKQTGFARAFLLTLLFAVLAVFGNVLSVSVFYGVDLIFGSIFVFIAVSMLGGYSGLIVAVAGGLYTWLLWGHPYALVVFALEAVVVYWLHRQKGRSLIMADGLFWLGMGLPMITFFYAFGMDLPMSEAGFIAVKQCLNGLFNAVVAGLLMLILDLVTSRVSLAYLRRDQVKAILFNSIFAIALSAGTLPIIQYGKLEEHNHIQLLEAELSGRLEQLVFFLDLTADFDDEDWLTFLERMDPYPGIALAVIGSEGNVIASSGDPWILPDQSRILSTNIEELQLLEPEQSLPRLQRWMASRYQILKPISSDPGVTVIGQLPAGPLAAMMRNDSVHVLGLLGALLLVAIAISRFLSGALTMPMWRLSTVLNSSTNGLIITSTNGQIKWVNEGFTRITGYSLDRIRGQKPGDFLQGENTDQETVSRIRDALEHREPFEEEILNYSQDGRAYWVRINCEPLYRETGELTGFLAVQSEITEYRKTIALEQFGSDAIKQIIENATLEDIYLTVIRNVESLIPNLRCVVDLTSTTSGLATGTESSTIIDVNSGNIQGLGHCKNQSLPIVDSSKVRLGTLKVFYTQNTHRSSEDSNVLEKAARIIAIAMERHSNERRLKESASVFRWAREGIFTTDADFSILDANDAFTNMTGHSKQDVIGSPPDFLYSNRSDRELFLAIESVLRETGQWQGETWIDGKAGVRIPVRQSISAIRGDHGEIQRYSFILSDITELKTYQDQLEKMAKYDELTGLPNRVLLGDRLEQAMRSSERSSEGLAVLFIDLDHFKEINDHHGHAAGDQLLKQVAAKISHELRAGDTLARFGGDEFVVVLPELSSVDSCGHIAKRVLTAISGIKMLSELRVTVSASIGIALYPQSNVNDAEQLFRQADQAMYAAKQKGKNQIQYFDSDNEKAVRVHNRQLTEISHGFENGEFVLFYQPQINLKTRELIGVEALIRWQHPEHGLLAPSKFLPYIDQHPLSITLGEWVLNTALAQGLEWRRLGLDMPISVNIDPFHLVQPEFVNRLNDILTHYPAYRPGDIELEIIETASLERLEEVADVINNCRKLGISCSLDDFGTGYSSLAYLKGLPVDRLKIDMSFVRNMLSDSSDFAIVDGVLGLARSFDLGVIAEGVETADHVNALMKLGCQFGQGYGISKPLKAADVPGWVEHWQSHPRERPMLEILHSQ